MERVLNLKMMQSWRRLKLSAVVAIGLNIIGIIINYLMNGNFGEWSIVSDLVENLLSLCWMIFIFFVFGTCLSDGLVDFDAALRFGINRFQYFVTNLCIYVIFAMIDLVVQVFFKQGGFNGSSFFSTNLIGGGVTLQNFIICFAPLFIFILFGHLYYRFGNKILIATFSIPFIGGLVMALVDNLEITAISATKIMNLFNWISNHLLLCTSLLTIVFIATYYYMVMKTEAN